MDWIHCNACYNQPRSRDPNYVLSSCGHIFCKNCESREKAECLTCNAPCMFMALGPAMKPELREYFDDVETKCKNFLNALRFQKQHRLNLYKRHARIAEQYQQLKEENINLKTHLKKALKRLDYYERKIRTPAPVPPSPCPSDNFIFTPNGSIVRGENHDTLNGASTTRNPAAGFQFPVPNLDAYKKYRGVHAHPTPGSADSLPTPDRFVRQFNNRITLQPGMVGNVRNGPENMARTPSSDDLTRLNIHGRRYRAEY